ncbi:MAG: hypothetical protein SGI89_02650 [bacterium]|nr:hypothetical protein [bacterium]
MTVKEKLKNSKTSKGYRLKESTHCLIEKVQIIIDGSKDTVISKAVKLYYLHLTNPQKHPEMKNNSNTKIHKPF